MEKIKTYKEFYESGVMSTNEFKNDTFNDRELLNEMASINLKDGSKSPFDYGKFKVDILNKEGNKEPHFHVISKSERFDIRIKIEDGELLSVKSYGRRKGDDKFTDIVKLAKEWLPEQSKVDEFRTNKQYAYLQFYVMNPDSPYIRSNTTTPDQ